MMILRDMWQSVPPQDYGTSWEAKLSAIQAPNMFGICDLLVETSLGRYKVVSGVYMGFSVRCPSTLNGEKVLAVRTFSNPGWEDVT